MTGQEEAYTSQFVAVSGTREKIQPALDGSSPVRRMYLSVRTMVSPPKSNHRLCISESRYGYVILRQLLTGFGAGSWSEGALLVALGYPAYVPFASYVFVATISQYLH